TAIDVNGFHTFSVITPSAADALALDGDTSSATNTISGSSGGVSFSPLTFSNVAYITLDAATHESTATHDTFAVASAGLVANGLTNFEFQGGAGNDALTLNGNFAFNTNIADKTPGASVTVNGASTLVKFNITQKIDSLTI